MAEHDHDRGLQRDLLVLASALDRRQVLGWLAVAASIPVVGCTDSEDDTGGDSDSDDTAVSATCEPGDPIPGETVGPFPGDGSNGPDALEMSGVVRGDIRPNIGASGEAEGVLLTMRLRILDSACAPLAGHAVYVWHCDRDGEYSMYGDAASATYLRGVQVTDADGVVTFTTVFPGCYPGRWPHVHFEIYPDLASTSNAASKLATSQLAFPEDACNDAYAAAGYEDSVTALSNVNLETDLVFFDGSEQQVATVTGNATAGFVAELIVPINA